MATGNNNLEIIAEHGTQECFIIREFDFPRELVFHAFSDPDIFAQFWGPDDVNMHIDYYNFKSGIAYLIVSSASGAASFIAERTRSSSWMVVAGKPEM